MLSSFWKRGKSFVKGIIFSILFVIAPVFAEEETPSNLLPDVSFIQEKIPCRPFEVGINSMVREGFIPLIAGNDSIKTTMTRIIMFNTKQNSFIVLTYDEKNAGAERDKICLNAATQNIHYNHKNVELFVQQLLNRKSSIVVSE